MSVIGPRRIGKSSLLFHLADPAVFKQYGFDPAHCCFIYIACESWSHLPQTDLYTLILQELDEALARAGHTLDLNPPAAAATTYRTLEQAIRTVVGRQIRLFIMLDEFEALSINPHLDIHFFSGLRGLATRHGVAFITASTALLYDLTYIQATVLSSPFFNFFAQIRLHPFSQPEAKAVLQNLAAQEGLEFSPTTIDFLYALAGPHPFFIQVAGYHAFEVRARQTAPLDETDLEQVRQRFLIEAEPHWRYFWHKLMAQEQKSLAMLPVASPPEVKRLVEAGLVVREGDAFQPLSPAFRDFVDRQPMSGVLQAPPIILDSDRYLALCRGRPLALTPTEFTLLAYLIIHAGQVVSHRDLEAHVWPDESYVKDPERLKSTLKSLRRALGSEAECIQNVRGVGYRFNPT